MARRAFVRVSGRGNDVRINRFHALIQQPEIEVELCYSMQKKAQA